MNEQEAENARLSQVLDETFRLLGNRALRIAAVASLPTAMRERQERMEKAVVRAIQATIDAHGHDGLGDVGMAAGLAAFRDALSDVRLVRAQQGEIQRSEETHREYAAQIATLRAALRSTKSSLMGCWCETPTIDENGHHQHDERCDKIRAALGGP